MTIEPAVASAGTFLADALQFGCKIFRTFTERAFATASSMT
jgi:hypothetical protein